MNNKAQKSFFGLKNWFSFKDVLSHMIFPSKCLICENEMPSKDATICTFCSKELHYTFFENYTEPTFLDQLFWGRVSLESTFALLYFEKEKSTQTILHALKYKSNPQIGITFGEEIGRRIKKNDLFKDIDVLIPVPIHPKKEFVRGYNQSEKIAEGISKTLEIPIDSGYLKKHHHTGSQTTRGRFARWDNVARNFIIRRSVKTYKHVAIVDDVVTTGATIEALVRSIKENNPDIRVSVISLALAK